MADSKKILITGAGSGFGLGAAVRLHDMGHQVIGGTLDAGQADLLHQHGIRSVQLDITDPVDIAAVDALDLDVLVNNAGRGQLGALADIDIANVRKVFEVNVFGTLQVTQAAIPAMKRKTAGRIIIVSSIAGVFSGQLTGPYAMTKHALEAMAKSLRAELAPYGITVAKLNPGPYATGFNDQMVEGVEAAVAPGTNEAEMASDTRKRMLGNQLDPQEVIDTMVSLCVDDPIEFETFKPDDILERYGARIVKMG